MLVQMDCVCVWSCRSCLCSMRSLGFGAFLTHASRSIHVGGTGESPKQSASIAMGRGHCQACMEHASLSPDAITATAAVGALGKSARRVCRGRTPLDPCICRPCDSTCPNGLTQPLLRFMRFLDPYIIGPVNQTVHLVPYTVCRTPSSRDSPSAFH